MTFPIHHPTPNCIFPTTGHAEGITELNAFDNALLMAHIGNLNLVKLSSVIPAGVSTLTERPIDMQPGAIVYTVFSKITSSVPGQLISCAIGMGFQPHNGSGTMFEISGVDMVDIEHQVSDMVQSGFEQRNYVLDKLIVISSHHVVEKCGCALSAVPLWWL